ncbi:MAG: SipW-dependent-type signal peptide-containing protein [Microbacteriaceae bacterium]|nr:SipW-dependent-type signal peptide-containing protein [Microbacteriaceae bacterium]MCL2794195.1 SipW-dependent-type signal peptide-containing protein [Microbacteriaceae bacterium]
MAEKDKKRRRRNVVLAILAGGSILGVGAAVTLATWQDDEYANGTFTAGTFDLQGQVNTTEGFAEHATAPGGALGFDLNASNLSPTDVTYSPYAVQLSANTTSAATVTVSAATPTNAGNTANLTYAVYEVSTWGCSSATTLGTALIPAGTALGTVPAATTFTLAAAATPQYLCFVVTAGSGLTQGQSAAAVWDFHATSTTSIGTPTPTATP